MKKKGFTLVELLAVIAILAILVIIALPNVMGMFNQAKHNSFNTEVKNILKQAGQQWVTDGSMSSTTGSLCYQRKGTNDDSISDKYLLLSGRTNLNYAVCIDKAGRIVQFAATDGTYVVWYSDDNNDLTPEKVSVGNTPASGTAWSATTGKGTGGNASSYVITDFGKSDAKITAANSGTTGKTITVSLVD